MYPAPLPLRPHLRGTSPRERKTLLVVKAACGRFPLVYVPRQARLISCQFASADVLLRYDIDNWKRHCKQWINKCSFLCLFVDWTKEVPDRLNSKWKKKNTPKKVPPQKRCLMADATNWKVELYQLLSRRVLTSAHCGWSLASDLWQNSSVVFFFLFSLLLRVLKMFVFPLWPKWWISVRSTCFSRA